MIHALAIFAALFAADAAEAETDTETTATAVTVTESATSETTLEMARLTTPTPIAHGTEPGAHAIAGVAAALEQTLSSGDRRRLGAKVLSASRVTMVEGAFSDGALVVTVNVPMRLRDPEAQPKFISGVFTLDADMGLAEVIVAPKMRPQRYDLVSVGDVDADGIDDLVLEVSDDEEDAQRLVRWADGAPTEQAMPEDTYEEGC